MAQGAGAWHSPSSRPPCRAPPATRCRRWRWRWTWADPASAQACAAAAIALLGGLDALLNAGIDLHYRCKEGVCGTCEVTMLAGEIDHRDGVLSPAEHARGDLMMICVSGCKGPALVLDVCGRAAAS